MEPTLSNLKPPRGSRHRKVRVGRGMGSKLGKTVWRRQQGTAVPSRLFTPTGI